MSCPTTKIRRDAYTRKDGTYVPSTCVPDTGKPGKTPASQKVLPKPKAGVLTSKGYRAHKSADARHRALDKVIKEQGESPLSVFRHLNLIANYTTLSNPEAHAVYKRDMAWIKNKYGLGNKKKSRKSQRKSRKSQRKSRKSRRKSRKSRRKSRKSKRKSRKSRRKSRKSRRKSRKSRRKSRKSKRKSRKSKR